MYALYEKAKLIRLLLLDVDGVLTSGVIYYGNEGQELKGFHVHDGLGIKLLQRVGVQVAIISAKQSTAVLARAKDLEIKHVFLGHEIKLPIYEQLKQMLQLKDEEIAYFGDDLMDLALLRRAGLAITVPQAPKILFKHVDWITNRQAGKGAVREVCELILEAQAHYQSLIQNYL